MGLIKAKTTSKANGNCAIASASPVDALVKTRSDLRPGRLNHLDTHYQARPSPWPRQALENFRQAIQKQRWLNILRKTCCLNLLTNIAQGAEGKPSKNHSRPNLLSWIFQVAPFRKSNISERQQTSTTSQAARLYGTHFLCDEPLLETNKWPPFLKYHDASDSGTRPNQRKACHCLPRQYLYVQRGAWFLLGKIEQKQTTNQAGIR